MLIVCGTNLLQTKIKIEKNCYTKRKVELKLNEKK